jgi:excinuclease ABC subunit A
VAEAVRGDLVIRGAREHNLRGLDLAIPRGQLTVVTGVSGSGKSSLAFDTLFREGQRRFLETLPAFARQFAGGLARPAVTAVEGLGPAIAVGQRVALGNPRSTVGTLTEVWDLLRLLFARLGRGPGPDRPRRGLFSFNGPEGACPRCQGLGVEDRLDLDLLVADPAGPCARARCGSAPPTAT